VLRFLTAGESHGQALIAILEGLPAGLPLSRDYIRRQLLRRRAGYGRGARMKLEDEQVRILSGLRFGRTLGSPLALLLPNRDWKNWERLMAVEASEDKAPPLTLPRPGHADLAGALKYGFRDLRNVLERASARETAARVALGAVARRLLEEFGLTLFSHVLSIGGVRARAGRLGWEAIAQRAEASSLRCADPGAETKMKGEIDRASAAGDSLGGVFQVVALNPPPGLGSYAHWDRRLDARLAAALMSIPAVKGVEIGLGFKAAARPGSRVHDPILPGADLPGRKSNNAGGLEGGVTNGQPLLLQAAMKPISTLRRPLPSVDLATGKPASAHVERADVCAVAAAAVVGEAMVALTLADALLEKFGSDSLADIKAAFSAYRARLSLVSRPKAGASRGQG
jgi:chorismate synthase